jgi:hypothetical protein
MYSIYKRGGYPQPPTLPVGNKYCPPIPGIVPLSISVYPVFSTFISTISSVFVSSLSTFTSTINVEPPFVSTFSSTIVSQYQSSIIFQSAILSTPTNYVALGNSYKSLSESGRMQSQQCTTMYISNAPVPVQRGDSNNIPYIDVIAASASGTTQSIQNAVLFCANNPYNPATRFAQYFPRQPPPPPCIISPPNPGAIIGPCSPPLMFRGSVENVGPT